MSRRWRLRLRLLGLWLLLLPWRLLLPLPLPLLLLLLGWHCCRLGAARRGRRRRSSVVRCLLLLRVPPSSLVLRRRRAGAGLLSGAPGSWITAASGLGNQHGGLQQRFLPEELHPLSLVLDRHTQRDVLQAGSGGPQVGVRVWVG